MPEDHFTSPDDILRLIKVDQKSAARRDRIQNRRLDTLNRRMDVVTGKVKGLYVHLTALSTLIVGDIVARYISSK